MDKTQRIIRKAIDVLHKDEFLMNAQLAYVLGMLESLVDGDHEQPIEILTHPDLHRTAMQIANAENMNVKVNGELSDEAALLDAKARAAIQTVKELSDNA